MGCDIHFYVEVKEDGEWKNYNWREDCWELDENGKPVVLSYSDGATYQKTDYDKLFSHPLYVDRNYSVFSILANVRNGYGFAGCDTGDGFVPIDRPRGLPKDVSREVKRESYYGHSHSYLTIQELLDYNWDRTTKCRGVLGVEEYKVFQKEGKPQSWSGGVGGEMVKHISNEEMEERILRNDFDEEHSYFTSVEWEQSYGSCCERFVKTTLPELCKLGPTDQVRIVFWFDN